MTALSSCTFPLKACHGWTRSQHQSNNHTHTPLHKRLFGRQNSRNAEGRKCFLFVIKCNVNIWDQKMAFRKVRASRGSADKSCCRSCLVVQLCLTLCDPVNCSPPGSSVRGIFQATMLEWIAISFSRGSSWPRNQTPVRFFTTEPPREAPLTKLSHTKKWALRSWKHSLKESSFFHPLITFLKLDYWFSSVYAMILYTVTGMQWTLKLCLLNEWREEWMKNSSLKKSLA